MARPFTIRGSDHKGFTFTRVRHRRCGARIVTGLQFVSYIVLIVDLAMAALPSMLFLYIERKRLCLEDLFMASAIAASVAVLITGSGLDPVLSQLVRGVLT